MLRSTDNEKEKIALIEKTLAEEIGRPNETQAEKQDRGLLIRLIRLKIENMDSKNFFLCLACYYGYDETAKYLIDSGANPRAVITSLSLMSSKVNAQEIFKEIGVNMWDDYHAEENKPILLYPIQIALLKRHYRLAELLIQNGAKVDDVYHDKLTLFSPASMLFVAAREGDDKLADFLLKAGADVNKKNNTGLTALHLAALKEKADVVGTLLNFGANTDALYEGKTPMKMTKSKQIKRVFDFHFEKNRKQSSCTLI